MKPRILVVDDDSAIRDSLKMVLEYEGYEVMLAATGDEGVKLVEREAPDLVFLDIKMPGMDGLEVLQKLEHMVETTPIVVISGHADMATAVKAIKLGAFDFIGKPLEQDRILVTVRNAVDTRRIKTENKGHRRDADKKYQIVGDSPTLAAVRSAIQKAAPTNATVLIWGESGVGKELVARALHRLGPRRGGPFRDLNCAALTEDLLDAELFGHARGAFIGALADRRGLIEEADGGTLFLDELADLSPRGQAKLLRVLQEREVRRIGEVHGRSVDVRVVSAANRDMRARADDGAFRPDLLYRLDVIRLDIPSLRTRPEDIAPLVRHFWRDATHRMGSVATLSRPVLEALTNYHWPGNVRQLQNVVAATSVLAPTHGDVQLGQLPLQVRQSVPRAPERLGEARAAFERRFIEPALARAGGRRTGAARVLGVSRQGLAKLLQRHQIAGGVGDAADGRAG